MVLPQQTRILVPVTFTAIESAFYRDIKQRLLTSAGIDTSSFADDQQLVKYIRERFSGDAAQLRSTLLALRQACTHPQVAGSGVRGTALAASQTIRSIDEVLTIMIEGAKSEADTLWHSLVQKRIDRAVLLLQRKEYEGRHEIAKLMLSSTLDDVRKRQDLLRKDVDRAQVIGPLYRFDSAEEQEAAARSDASQARTASLVTDVQPKTPAEREKEHAIAEKALLRRRHLNALQLRQRNYLEQEHRCHCFLGNVFFQLGELAKERTQVATEKTDEGKTAGLQVQMPDQDTNAKVADLKKNEDKAYDAAESVRQELLKETRKVVEQAIDSVNNTSIDFTLEDIQSLVDAGEGGLRSAVQFDRLLDMQRLLNKHAEVLFDWREKIWQRLQKPVNRVVSDEDENDDQYAENLDAQAEAEALLEMYRILVNEREYMLTGLRIEGTLSKPQLYVQLEREVPQHERALKRSSLMAAAAPELRRHDAGLDDWLLSEQEVGVMRQQLDHFRALEKQLKRVSISQNAHATSDPSRTRRRRLSGAGQELEQAASDDEEDIITVDLEPLDSLQRELREIQQNTDRTEEVAIARHGLENIRQIQAKQKQMIEKLKRESLSFSAVWNARAAYFKQIQDVSDQVRDIATTDVAEKTANLEREEATLKRREEMNAGRLRYLQAIEEEEESGGDTIDSNQVMKTCPICTEQLIRAVVLDVCGHTTCENCFRHWTVQHRRCPMCKSSVNIRSVYRVTYGRTGKKRNVEHPETEANVKRKAQFNVIHEDLLRAIQRQPLRSTLGSKLDLLTRHLLHINYEQPGSKSLIFTAFARGISLVGDALRLNGIKFVTLDQGGARGGTIIDTFKNDKNVNVLLLHSEAQSSGLNLVCARNIFLLEPLVNHALELQAIGRVHRIGQTRETSVFCYQVSDTVEQRIIEMAQKRDHSLFTLDNCISSDLKDSAELTAKVQQTKGLARSNRGLRDGEFVGHVDEMISCLFPDVEGVQVHEREQPNDQDHPEPSAGSSSSFLLPNTASITDERERMRQERLDALKIRLGQL
jgi:E3 ubiquitin-protein ligase SHPRH